MHRCSFFFFFFFTWLRVCCQEPNKLEYLYINYAPSSEFMSSSIPSWQILTAHAQPFRGARELAFCLKVPLDSLLVWASSEGSGETARMRKLAWTFAARTGDKYKIRLTRSNYKPHGRYGSVVHVNPYTMYRIVCLNPTDISSFIFADKHNNITYDLDDKWKQVDTIAYF